ncbi:MAG: SDR family NAD(P)-dependent oxidoreductase [Phenylobacterium sp.]|nr:SDR family NAD(P)-dependent oxidoreductase [Phenylobacterium sp.]MCA6263971.1 SDR family NAD(P)-dependent oxidoreductase [Phenylobacterium sp.]MCA6306269.1 SDR family NAD(P)-dependent oxidoreductase [Phenylobacterium sp.]MCA6315953.1 SDR family NAD(P)-dependent oxidoreductase [Phenylobacterium sp.]MCA6319996.1 SDR family NAD(P)-dependent oxidoreductase [Phenylobacterium sp.]
MGPVVVTGASSGIGRACVERLAKAGVRTFPTVRKEADALSLTEAFGALVEPVLADVTDAASLARAAAEIEARLAGSRLGGLVNNAGVALPGPALSQPLDEIQRVIDTNLVGAMRAVQAFGPLLGAVPGAAGPKGRIVNITSVSGKFGYPFTAAYAASKHGLEGYSESLRRELMLTGVDVIVVGPGAVKTPIWDKGAAVDRSRYAGTGWAAPLARLEESLAAMDEEGLEASVVADVVLEALTAARPKPRYAPVPQPLVNWWLPRLLPKRLIDGVIADRLGLRPTAASG